MRWGPTFCHILICSFVFPIICVNFCLPALILWSSQLAFALFACCLYRSLSFLLLQFQKHRQSPWVIRPSRNQPLHFLELFLCHQSVRVPMRPVPGALVTEWWEGFLGVEFILKWSLYLQMMIRPHLKVSNGGLVLRPMQEPTARQPRGKLGYWTTTDLLCCGWFPVGDGWDHRTRGSLLILDFFWLKASFLASWGAVNAFLWHTTLLSKKSLPSFEIAPVLSA